MHWLARRLFSDKGTFGCEVLLGCLLLVGAGKTSAEEPEVAIPAVRAGAEAPAPPLEPAPVQHRRRTIIVSVTYGADGRVRDCKVMRSNATRLLEVSTLEHIRKHWGGAFFADSVEVVPIQFDETTTTEWTGDMATPPNVFPDDNHAHEMTIRVSFDREGWVASTKVMLSSGIQIADEETAAWVRVHWHSDAYAGKAVDAPFIFQSAKKKPSVSLMKPKASDQVDVPLGIPPTEVR